MKVRFACMGLLIIMVLVSAGCVPIITDAMAAPSGGSRGAVVPTATPTSPVSPLPTPTSPVSPLPTPTFPVSPLAAPTMVQAQGQPSTAYTDYAVRQGDTLGTIAAKFGVKISEIRAANPQLTSPDRIWIGQRLRIPSK